MSLYAKHSKLFYFGLFIIFVFIVWVIVYFTYPSNSLSDKMNNMEISFENLISIILAIIAVIVSIISLIITYRFNKKTLQQSEKNLKIQLFYEDRKKAIFKLNKILEGEKYFLVRTELLDFLKLPESLYLPLDIKKSILNKIKKIDELIKEKDYDRALKESIPLASEEEALEAMIEEANRQEDPEEWVEDRLKEKFSVLKKDIIDKSRKKLKDLNDKNF